MRGSRYGGCAAYSIAGELGRAAYSIAGGSIGAGDLDTAAAPPTRSPVGCAAYSIAEGYWSADLTSSRIAFSSET